MPSTIFLALSAMWLVGFTYFKWQCVRIESEFDPQGHIGSFLGLGWLRGSNDVSRLHRKRAMTWAVVGMMVVVLATRWAMRSEG